MRRIRMNQDRGAAVVMVALFMVALLAVVAFAIDTGSLYEERRELQNSADAAALAIAEDCGWGLVPCDNGYATATAESYADANNLDTRATIDEVDLDFTGQSVTVGTSTETSGGGTILKPFFAQVVGFGGSTVRAHATAIWGYPSKLGTLPLIISECEWNQHSDKINTDQLVTFYYHRGQGPPKPGNCTAQAGQDWDLENYLPGGFGWLDSTDCWAETGISLWVPKDPGSSVTSGCSPAELYELLMGEDGNGNTVEFPYFDKVRGNGTIDPPAKGGTPPQETGRGYRVMGFGAIHVTGYNFGGQYKVNSTVDGKAPCNGDDRCLQGYLTTDTASGGQTGGPNMGILIVRLTG